MLLQLKKSLVSGTQGISLCSCFLVQMVECMRTSIVNITTMLHTASECRQMPTLQHYDVGSACIGNLPVQRYQNMILRPHVIFIIHNINAIYRHDNAQAHTAQVATAYLQANSIQALPGLSKTPDLNPIEQLQDELDRSSHQRPP